MRDDAADIRVARNRWTYNQGQHAISMFTNDRSLIAWTLSPEWTEGHEPEHLYRGQLSWYEVDRDGYVDPDHVKSRRVRNGEIVTGECG